MQTILDEAQQGVILFSLGTITSDDALNPDLRTVLIRTFEKIPQRVLWKFNGKIDGLSNNVLLRKRFPQKEILGKYRKLFYYFVKMKSKNKEEPKLTVFLLRCPPVTPVCVGSLLTPHFLCLFSHLHYFVQYYSAQKYSSLHQPLWY